MQPSGYPRIMQVRALTLMPIVALICSATATVCLAETHTLSWPAKAGNAPQYQPPQAMGASTPALPQGYSAAPPSPYGNVGDPFVRRLNWQSKQTQEPHYQAPHTQVTPPMPVTYSPPVEPTRRPSVIMPALVPAPALPLDMPPPPATAPAETPRVVAPKPVTAPVAAPTPKPAPAPVVSSEHAREGAYQIPQTSKYYRGTRSDNALPPVAAPEAPKPEATKPADQAFVPGEPITDARTQSPRLYSLHRQYGLTPDAISSVSDNAPAPQSEAPAPSPAPSKPPEKP